MNWLPQINNTVSGFATGGPIIEDLSTQQRDALYPCLGNVRSGMSTAIELQLVGIMITFP